MPIAWSLAAIGFLGPFWLLLFRGLKRRRRSLGAIAGLLIVMQMIVVYWLIEPAFAPDGPLLDWRLPLLWVGLGGVWLALFAWRLSTAPILAPNDPRLAPAIEPAGAHATA
jgi:peptidoglycan/LPS O-acetylase OafA/YrhL